MGTSGSCSRIWTSSAVVLSVDQGERHVQYLGEQGGVQISRLLMRFQEDAVS